MKGKWRQVAFADVIELISGGTTKTSVAEYWGGSIPWLSVADFNTGYRWVDTAEKSITERGLAESATCLLNAGDIIISARGTVGIVAQLAKPMAFNQSCYGIRGRQDIAETNFIYYALRHAVWQMQQFAHGGVFSTITRETFKIINTQLPPLKEQQAIACILGSLDDKIELNRRMNKTLEAMARGIFKSWFIDFDPVKRNMARKAGQNQPSPPTPLPKVEGRRQYRGGYGFAGLVETVRELRKKQTPAEAIFWELVRNGLFMGLKFRRQHQIGDYIADFYCHEHRLVIEFDGGIHASRQERDGKRDAWMEAQGFKVFRFPNEQLLEDAQSILTDIAAVIEPDHPSTFGRRAGDEGCVGAFDALFPDSFQDSELGEIPRGWEVLPFADTIKIFGGGTPKTSISEYWDGDIPWYAVGDAPDMNDVYVIDTAKKITKLGVEKSSTQILPVETIIISARGTVGKLALTGVPMAMNQTCYGLQGKIKNTNYFTYFSTQNLIETLKQNTHGSVFDTITRDTLSSIKVVFSPCKIIEQYVMAVKPVMEKILNNLWQIRTLAALRDALLPKLISGEIRIKDAERFLKEGGL